MPLQKIKRLRKMQQPSQQSYRGNVFPEKNRTPDIIPGISWWRHQMETFSALLAICAGNSPVHGEFPAQRSTTRSFYASFDIRPNKRLSKQSWGWWFETPSRPLWRHCNDSVASSYAPSDLCGIWIGVRMGSTGFRRYPANRVLSVMRKHGG